MLMNLKKILKLLLPPIFFPKKIKEISENFFTEKNILEFEKCHQNRISLISLACQNYDFHKCKYLEIGVFDNYTFNSVPIKNENKIGVDPISGGTHRVSSDNFFDNNKEKFDIIFIDGLHTYDQVCKDLNNSLKAINDDGIIFIHDLLPRNFREQQTPCKTVGLWTGDVWKVSQDILACEHLDFIISKFDHGVGIIKKKKNIINSIEFNQEKKSFKDYKNNLDKLPIASFTEACNFIIKN